MKKYFLKDATLKNVDGDQFRYQDFANNLRKIIECNKTPFNIAIVGKWGLGKSSLINMALAPLSKKEDEYLICDINAWKYEKDEIGKAFLKELYENVSKQKILSFNFFHKDYDTLVKDDLNKEVIPNKNENWKKLGCFVLISFVISLIAFFVYCGVSNDFYGIKFSLWDFIKSTSLRYCKNIGSILIIPLIVWLGKLFMDKLNVPANKNYEVSFPLETQADYEIYLRNLLDKYCDNNPNKKIVVVVDDLDRLSAEKIVEALDALKIFMEYKEFVFIVPFDDEILKNALDKNKLNQINDYDNRYDGDMVLDKLFQYKIYLPQLIKSDMRNYAFHICREDCTDFINEFFDGSQELFEEIAGKILIHNNVSTPRQVKKIINTFIENVMVARDRELAKRVSKGFASEKKGLETIAKISVLQADYNGFYDILFKDVNAIDEILEIHRNGTDILISQILEKYFVKKQDSYILKKEYESLVNFLSFTENLGYSNITPYLYMAQTEAGVIVGDQRQQDFMAAIESCNFVTAKQFLKETPVLLDVLIEQLKYDETSMMGNMVISAVECWNSTEDDKKIHLAKTINERIKSIILGKLDFRHDLINVKALVDLCKAIDSNQYNYLIEFIFDLCEGEQEQEKLIRKITNIKDELSDDVRQIFEQTVRTWIASEESGVNSIIEFVNEEDLEYIANTYGIAYIERMAKHITENDDFEKDITSQFGDVLKEYLKNNSIIAVEDMLKPCFEYPIMHGVLNAAINSSNYKEMKLSKDVADIIIAIGVEKLKDESAYDMLTKLTYKIGESDKEKYDDFFLATIEQRFFAKLILAFAKDNPLEMLPKTIKTLTENTFKYEGYEEDARLLVNKFSEKQAEQFWTTMKAQCAYASNKEYGIVTDVLLELVKEHAYTDNIRNIITQVIIPNMRSYYNIDNYCRFSGQIISGFKDNMSKEELDEYSSLLLKAISTDTNSVLNVYRSIHLYISEAVWCKNVVILLSAVSKGTYPVIYDIIVSRSEFFNKANKNLSQLITFLVDYIGMSEKPDDVINEISNKFTSISNADKLIKNIIDLDIDEENTSLKLSKFIDSLDVSDIIKIVTDEIDYKNKLINIFSKSQKYASDMILAEVSENREEISKADLVVVLDFYQTEINRENIGDFVEIANYMKMNYFEKDVCDKILQIISTVPTSIVEIRKQEICTLLTSIFKDSSSEDVKKKCAILIKDKKLSQKARGMLSKEQITEYKSYISK